MSEVKNEKAEKYFAQYEVFSAGSIVGVSERGIELEDGLFIDFEECAANFAEMHTGASSCVGERDAPGLSFTFYTAANPTEIKFIMKNKFIEFFAKENTARRFHKLQKQIEGYGYNTYDIS